MKEINKFRNINKLKSVYRATKVDKRNESSAEHSWSCLILANYLLPKIKIEINTIRVYELLMYHDLVEIIAGDTVLHPKIKINKQIKLKNEKKGARRLQKKLPNPINKNFIKLFNEYKKQKTPEAKFAKIIDSLDVMIHQLDYKKDWKDWSSDFLIKNKTKHFKDFPELEKIFYELLDYLLKNNYINK